MLRICLLFMFTLIAYESSIAQCINGNCAPVNLVAPIRPMVYPSWQPPSTIYRPVLQFQPLQYQGSTYQPRAYRTPLRSWLFGTGTVSHYYQPQPQQ